ncbi:hypothetical protein V8C35DRAFT_294019 [Trichoderma chlorosporum]
MQGLSFFFLFHFFFFFWFPISTLCFPFLFRFFWRHQGADGIRAIDIGLWLVGGCSAIVEHARRSAVYSLRLSFKPLPEKSYSYG